MSEPPDAIAMEFATTDERIPTPLSRLVMSDFDDSDQAALTHGIFQIGFGRSAFFGPVYDGGRIRFDPVAMRPLDPLAAKAVEVIRALSRTANQYQPAGEGYTLIVDNRQTMHGRSPVPPGTAREVKRLMIRWDAM